MEGCKKKNDGEIKITVEQSKPSYSFFMSIWNFFTQSRKMTEE